MEIYSLIGAALYFLACVFVGGRLALLARRTGERPEQLLGSAFLTGGAIGYPLLVAAGIVQQGDLALSRVLFFTGSAIAGLSAVLLAAFWRRVYHPGSGAARGTIYVLAAAIYASLAVLYVSAAPGESVMSSGWYVVNLVCQGVPYALNAVSGALLYRSLRLRVPLGLEQPMVANRVFLWASAASAIATQYVYATARTLLSSQPNLGASGPDTMIISTLGLVCGVGMFLAFFPSDAYRGWVEGRAATS